MVKREFKLSADISNEAKEKLVAICQKSERSRGQILERMINKFYSETFPNKKPPAKKEEYTYPQELNVSAWEEWKAYRKEVKLKAYKPTPRSEGAAIKNLLKLSGGDYNQQAAIINQSIANQYQGLFEVKGNEANKQTTHASGNGSAVESVNAALEKQRAEFYGSSEVMGSHGSILHGQVDEEERSGSVIELDNGDWSTI